MVCVVPKPAAGGGGWTPPYGLPGAGAAALIGTNNADAVKQSGVSSSDFNYAVFNSYGGGAWCPDMTVGGAWAIAGPGGHIAPGMNDMPYFDFTDATWKLRATSAAGSINPAHFNNTDFTNGGAAQTQDGYSEIVAAQPSNVPLPSHLYMSLMPISAAVAGNTAGKILRYGQSAVTTTPTRIGAVHMLDLDTTRWARVSNASRQFSSTDGSYERNTVYDTLRGRIYIFGE